MIVKVKQYGSDQWVVTIRPDDTSYMVGYFEEFTHEPTKKEIGKVAVMAKKVML